MNTLPLPRLAAAETAAAAAAAAAQPDATLKASFHNMNIQVHHMLLIQRIYRQWISNNLNRFQFWNDFKYHIPKLYCPYRLALSYYDTVLTDLLQYTVLASSWPYSSFSAATLHQPSQTSSFTFRAANLNHVPKRLCSSKAQN